MGKNNRDKRPSFVSNIQINASHSEGMSVYSDEELLALFEGDELNNKDQLKALHDACVEPFDFIRYLTLRVDASFFSESKDYDELKEAHELLTDLFDRYNALCVNFPSPSDAAYATCIEESCGLQQDIAQQCRFIAHRFFDKQEFQCYTQQDLDTWLQSSNTLSQKLPAVEAECRQKLSQLPQGSSRQEKLRVVSKFKQVKNRIVALNGQIRESFHLSDEEVTRLLSLEDENRFQQAVDVTFQRYFSERVGKFHTQLSTRFEKDHADVARMKRVLLTLDQRAQEQFSDSPELIDSAVSLFESHYELACFVDRICAMEIDSSDADEASYLKRVQEKFNALKERLMLSSFSPGSVFSKDLEYSICFSDVVQGKLLTFSSASYKLFLDDLFSHVHEHHGMLIDAMNEGGSLDDLYDILNQLVGYDAYLAARDFNKLLIGFFSQLKAFNTVLPGSAALPEDSFATATDVLDASFSPVFSRRNTQGDLLKQHDHDALDRRRRLPFLSPVTSPRSPATDPRLGQCQRFEKPHSFTMNTPGRITLAVGGGVALSSAIAGIALMETINTALPVAQLFAANPAVPVLIALLVLSLAAIVVGVGFTCYENGKREKGFFQPKSASSLSFLEESDISHDDGTAKSPGHD